MTGAHKRIMSLVRKSEGMTRQELANKLQFGYNKDSVNSAIDSLIESGKVIEDGKYIIAAEHT